MRGSRGINSLFTSQAAYRVWIMLLINIDTVVLSLGTPMPTLVNVPFAIRCSGSVEARQREINNLPRLQRARIV